MSRERVFYLVLNISTHTDLNMYVNITLYTELVAKRHRAATSELKRDDWRGSTLSVTTTKKINQTIDHQQSQSPTNQPCIEYLHVRTEHNKQ